MPRLLSLILVVLAASVATAEESGRRDWWSLEPVRPGRPPAVQDRDWSDHPVDRFILSRLEDSGLAPAADAPARTLIRRLSLALTGLPPTTDEVAAYLAACRRNPDSARRELVEQLLDSPHFGERWARHWMDVVRFTETHGNEWNYEVHHAWRYRDYLIRAINQDVPYDQFVREHIAGDLLKRPRRNRREQFNESVIGTAFFRFGEVNHDDCIALQSIGYDLIDNQLDTLTKAFQATTVACARCHDHKFDPVSMQDYYSLLGILRSSRLVAHTIDAPTVNVRPIRKLRRLKSRIRGRLSRRWRKQVSAIPRTLLAAEAERAETDDAESLAEGLDARTIKAWLAALKAKNPPLEHPLHAWFAVVNRDPKVPVGDAWRKIAATYVAEQQKRTEFNGREFETLHDFRSGVGDWQPTGHGLRDPRAPAGELALATDGDSIVQGLLPPGCYSHRVSQNLNGSLRSPILRTHRKHLSIQVLGDHNAAVRIVSNNCQLNYVNYRVLLSDKPTWITFEPPTPEPNLRPYVELLTKFNNPKFPDQLGTIGGAKKNDRVPWSEAAADPRSYFGIIRAVLHDGKDPPRVALDHLCRLFDGSAPTSLDQVAGRYAAVLGRAITRWCEGRAGEPEVRLVDWMVRNGLLENAAGGDRVLGELVAEFRRIERDELALPRVVPGLEDVDDGIDQPLLARGDWSSPGDAVPRRFLEVLRTSDRPLSRSGSGRLELARAIASPDNPLTARVMANRTWHHLFGNGLVTTVDDFGRLGEPPSHPRLLDHLAATLVEEDWSLKALIRHVLLSRTFRMAAKVDPAARTADPNNRLLHHFPARRLDAESIRDAILATSGRLDRSRFGMSIYPFRKESNADRRLFAGPLDGDGRRSVYIKTNLMEPTRFLSIFNTPGGKVCQGRRDVSNVPAQALALLNDPFVIGQAGVWAATLLATPGRDPAERIGAMFERALGRPASDREQREFNALLETLLELHQVPQDDLMTSTVVWKDVAHVVFNLKEFIYLP